MITDKDDAYALVAGLYSATPSTSHANLIILEELMAAIENNVINPEEEDDFDYAGEIISYLDDDDHMQSCIDYIAFQTPEVIKGLKEAINKAEQIKEAV